jgi:hypothetical protein
MLVGYPWVTIWFRNNEATETITVDVAEASAAVRPAARVGNAICGRMDGLPWRFRPPLGMRLMPKKPVGRATFRKFTRCPGWEEIHVRLRFQNRLSG